MGCNQEERQSSKAMPRAFSSDCLSHGIPVGLDFCLFHKQRHYEAFTLRSPKILNLWQKVFYIMSENIKKGAVLLVDMK